MFKLASEIGDRYMYIIAVNGKSWHFISFRRYCSYFSVYVNFLMPR